MRQRYETLDALRGLAALTVVVWHWQHFYFNPTVTSVVLPDRSIQPLYALLQPLYFNGWIAVDLFFSISGFVFFCLYAEPVAQRRVRFWTFAVNRFSRLYPLHLVTLLFMACLQALYWHSHGVFYVYQTNNFKYFILQLFFASNWWPTSPPSFNGPVWSVSIEVLLYGLFFVVGRAGLARPWAAAVLVVTGALLVSHLELLGRGIMSFYLGGLCFFLVRKVDRQSLTALGIAVLGALTAFLLKPPMLFAHWVTIIIAFPFAIVALALNETRLSFLTGTVRWLGNISYSSYLLHVPLIFSLVVLSERLGFPLYPQSVLFMLTVLGVLVGLSLASYNLFERPFQDWLRVKLDRSHNLPPP